MRLLTIAVVLLLALAGAGCGGGDEATSDTDTVVTETTDDTTTDETTDETTTDDTEGVDTGDFLAGDCQEVIAASQALGQASAAAAADLEAEESADAFDAFAEDAPEEIRADVQLMAEYYDQYIEAIRDVGIEPGDTPTPEQIAELSQIFASADFQAYAAAAQRFNAWAAQNC